MTAILAVVAATLGAVVGSFLNACIHRMPRGISLLNPKRSFCPACNRQIPWYENLPVASWLALRGKCSGCGSPISPRYLLVELLTAGIFLALWWRFGLPLAPVYWVFLSLLIAATFIDFEHFIIPDEITLGGTVAGFVLCWLVPEAMGVDGRWIALLHSLGGAALGFAILWAVVEGGRLVFGKKKHVFDPPAPFEWVRDGDRADIHVAGDKYPWEELFPRETNILRIRTSEPSEIDGRTVPTGELRFRYDRMWAGDEEIDLDAIARVVGHAAEIIVPREAMGFGDVKFIACIGSFLGWQAVLFTVFAASLVGAVAGVAGILLARGKAPAIIPFGPYLAVGAAGWLFGGRQLAAWYFSHFGAVFSSASVLSLIPSPFV